MKGNVGIVTKRMRTAADRRTEMTLFLYGCSDAAFNAVTADWLAARHGLPARDCEYELTIARQKRS